MPYSVRAASHSGDKFAGGSITVHPISHASFVMETPAGTIYCDPVGEAGAYASFPEPDLILITHEHGDHYKPDTLAALVAEKTQIIANPAVHGMIPDDLKANAAEITNGGSTTFGNLGIDAIPAYNTTEGRLQFHPRGATTGMC